MSLSAILIVKNEESNIKRCLDSVHDLCKEIIIVDTGCTDKTIEICKSFGSKVKVYDHPWEESFSLARNHSIKYATSDWLLWIDADEELDRDSRESFIACMGNKDYQGFFVKIINVLFVGHSDMDAPRLFRRDSNPRFEGCVHNQLKLDGKLARVSVNIKHYGYNLDDEGRKRKYERSLKLILRELETTDLPEYYQFCLARHYHFGLRHREAKEECFKLINMLWAQDHKWEESVYGSIHYTLFSACWYLGDYGTPMYWLMKILQRIPEYIDLHWCWAMCSAKRNDVKTAELGCHWYFTILPKYDSGEVSTRNQTFTLGYDHILLYEMANMYSRVNDKPLMIKASQKLKECLEARGVNLDDYIRKTKDSERRTEAEIRGSVLPANA